MLLYSHTISPRLKYACDFIGNQLLNRSFELTDDKNLFANHPGPKINYSNEKITEAEFRISPASLLFEKGIQPPAIECFETHAYKAFFQTQGDFSFDILAASFYLLSRYEEYTPHAKDQYGRYAHQNSLAFKEKFLHLPLINIWIENFKKELQTKFPALEIAGSTFQFIPTYDIDEAFSYKHKQLWRTIGGFGKSFVRLEWSKIGERLSVLLDKRPDPYDSFEWMDQLNKRYGLRPYYFFLIAAQTGKHDKNIRPSQRVMKDLIERHSKNYVIGIHPSWQSGDDPRKLRFEILKLGHIAGKQIVSSRQHFIRFTLPETYRRLIASGIQLDFSMGYGSTNGFRASVASPFYWYDLEKEEQTSLLLYPFCFMEANSFFEQKLSAQQALQELNSYRNIVSSVNGTLITIWHNTFLGTDNLFRGWREIYEQFVSSVRS